MKDENYHSCLPVKWILPEKMIDEYVNQFGNDPCLFKKRLDLLNRLGAVGERRTAAMIFVAIDSRLLSNSKGLIETVPLKVSGRTGTGKSYILKRCLKIYDSNAIRHFTGITNKGLYYLESRELKNRCLILEEAYLIEKKGQNESDLMYALRNLISEGKLKYLQYIGGNVITREVHGPTSFITTTTLEKLEPQVESRLFTVHPDESKEQTREVLFMTARQAANTTGKYDKWAETVARRFHKMLKPVEVYIPYGEDIARYLSREERLSVEYRRAFQRFLTVVKSIAAVHQFSALRSANGCIIADFCHYEMALQVARDAFRESVGGYSKIDNDLFEYIYRNGPVKLKTLAIREGKSKQDISAWNSEQVKRGNTMWCDADRYEFVSNKLLNKAKHSGRAYITIGPAYETDFIGNLPTTSELSNDSRWAKGGDLQQQYDLQLDAR